MSDAIDKLLDLLLDLEPPVNNKVNSIQQSAPKKQPPPPVKPKKKLVSEDKTLSKTESKAKNPQVAKPQKPISIAKVTEIIPNDPIQSITSAVSNLSEPKIKNFPSDDLTLNPSKIELEDWILQKEQQLNELAESINNLIPLMVELLSVKVNDSQEVILQTMIPVIDRAIEERSVQDLEKMSLAIARILPKAITQEIKIQPQSLGKAIAPELALSIEEQIRLDRDAISFALGSEMGKAIKAQIELEKDAMVDALYPVIGNTISKYLAEEIARINEKVENTLSPEGISRKIRAKMRGISEAELILQESLFCTVRAIFLIQKDSGLVMCEIQPDQQHSLESDLVAGMLTAIRSFANDCIISGSELSEIDYGNFQILLEAAGYCYIAVVINGQPKPQFRDRIRETLGHIVMRYGKIIENYDGDSNTIPTSINLLLKELTIIETEADAEGRKKPFTALFWLGGILLASILLPWATVKYRAVQTDRITQEVAMQLDSNPELSVYRLQPQVDQEKITITGKVPTNYLRNVAQEIVTPIATESKLNIDNQIIAVSVPPDPSITSQEVTRVTNFLNELPGVAVTSNYEDNMVTVTGFILETVSSQTVTSAFSAIPGVEQVIFTVKPELPTLEERIYFDSRVTEFDKLAEASKIESIKQFLDQYPSLNLKIIGHSDRRGSTSFNQKLALERANYVYQKVIALGINPERLTVIGSNQLPPDVSPSEPLWLSRCVRFEAFIPEKNSP